MSPAQQSDWFAQNAPIQDWFAANAPKADLASINAQAQQNMAAQDAQLATHPQGEGALSALGGDLWGLAKGAVVPPGIGMAQNAIASFKTLRETGKTPEQIAFAQRRTEGHSLPYSALAVPAAEGLGWNVQGMEQAADIGDMGGVLGHAAAVPVAAALTYGAGKLAGKARSIGPAIESYQSRPQAATLADAAKLPPKAVVGAEDVFRAAAPVGSDPRFRTNLYAAAGDLAEIARKTDLSKSGPGLAQGNFRPDLRIRATVDAIGQHMDQMYQTERMPQITRHADASIPARYGVNAKQGLEYLASHAGDVEVQALARRVLDGDPLTVSETDALARTTNQELKAYERAPADKQLELRATSPKISGLKMLDREITGNLNGKLANLGEPGVTEYERAYAALGDIKSRLQQGMPSAELERSTALGRVTRGMLGGKAGIASASQASVADVSRGARLQAGMKRLADSGIRPSRASWRMRGQTPPAPTPYPVNRQLPAAAGGRVPLSPSGEPIAPEYTPPQYYPGDYGARALPEHAGGGIPMPAIPEEPTILSPARKIIVRDRRTGRMRAMYLTSPANTPYPGRR